MSFTRKTIALLAVFALAPSLAQAAPPGRSAGKFDEADALERLRAADANGDGVTSRPELLAFRTQEWPRLDRNGDGLFSRDDLPGFARDRWDSPRLVSLRQTYDANRDGRISKGEFTRGPTVAFDMADANRDNRVTEAEIKIALAGARRR